MDQIIDEMLAQLVSLPDLTGIARCAGFYLLYQGLSQMKQSLADEREEHKHEVTLLQEKIRELEDTVNIKKEQ